VLFLEVLALAAPAPEFKKTDVVHGYQARMIGALSGESPVGTRFSMRLVGPISRANDTPLPANTVVRGVIRRTWPVGLGFRRERAVLELEFRSCELPTGAMVACSVQLRAVDNAREAVRKWNQVRGVVAASHPNRWFGGLWLRPTFEAFGKSGVGLTGAGGMIHSRILANPFAGVAIAGARTALFRMPDPEIYFPAGTDVWLRIAHPAPQANAPAGNEDDRNRTTLPDDAMEELRDRPSAVTQPDRGPVTDIINLAFVGSEDELRSAFLAAGWTEAEPLNPRTFMRTYRAFTSMQEYAAAPVSQLFHEGRAPDLVFQKAFNTLAKRHHIRVWRATAANGETVWVGAATHDIGIAFDWGRFSLTHRVDVRIDRERQILLNDLTDAGCIAGREWIERPALRSEAGPRVTDGALAVLQVQTCSATATTATPVPARKKHRPLRTMLRRIVLETRQYITRGNPYYYAFQTIRWTVTKRPRVAADE